MAKGKKVNPKVGAKSKRSAAGGGCGMKYWVWLEPLGEWYWLRPMGGCKIGCRSTKPPRDGREPFEVAVTPCVKRKKRTTGGKVGAVNCADFTKYYCEFDSNWNTVDSKCPAGCGQCVHRPIEGIAGGTHTIFTMCPGADLNGIQPGC